MVTTYQCVVSTQKRFIIVTTMPSRTGTAHVIIICTIYAPSLLQSIGVLDVQVFSPIYICLNLARQPQQGHRKLNNNNNNNIKLY